MTASSPTGSKRHWLAAILLLPTIVLAWPGPGSPLAGVFAATELTATAYALLAAIPMAIFALVRRQVARPRLFALWIPILLLAGFASVVPSWALSDTLELSRAQWNLFLLAIATLAGATTDPAIQRSFLRGTILLSLAFTGWALFGPSEAALGGILGNTGELACAALFGAVVGARALLTERGLWQVLGGAAFLSFAAQAALAPSIANVLAFSAALAVAVLWQTGSVRERALRTLVAGLPLALLFALKGPPAETLSPHADAPQPTRESVLGGVGVRQSVARGTLQMIGDMPLFGAGAGQFAVEFPPYRDPAEIAASSLNRQADFSTEVEHPHQDALLVISEFGLVAGGAWLGFLLLAARRALQLVRKGQATEQTVSLAVLAMLAATLANAPFGANPAAAVPAFVAMGMVLAVPLAKSTSPRATLALPGALLLLALFAAPRAFDATRHGRALAEISAAGDPSAQTYRDSLTKALEACPDSVVARSLAARLSQDVDQNPALTQNAWRGVLQLRPHRVEARLEYARQLALVDDYSGAVEQTTRALALDPENPTALRNQARFLHYGGQLANGARALDALEAEGLFEESFGESLAAGLLLAGQVREAQQVLERLSPEWADLDGDRAWVESGARKQAGNTRFADALESYAHLLWARDLAAGGNAQRAIAVYRQNLRITRDFVDGGPLRIRMELGAAEFLAGRTESAAATLEGLRPSAADWASMPPWAGTALRENKLVP